MSSTAAAPPRRARWRGRLGLGDDLGDIEEMALARVIGKAFTTLAEDVTAKQCQGLGQFGVLFLQLVVFRRGLIEHAFELIDAALGVFGLLLDPLGLLLSIFGLLLMLSACCRNSSLRRSRSSSNRWHSPGSSGRCSMTLIT